MAILDSTVVNGNLSVTGSICGASIYTSSDRNLKENINDINLDYLDYLDLVNKFELKEYNYISDENKTKVIGIIAQDLLEVLPEEYKESFLNQLDSEHFVVNTVSILYLAIGAIQQQQKQITDLKERLEKLEEKLN